jgi:hypothetical protein
LAFKRTEASRRFFNSWRREWECSGRRQDQGAAARAWGETQPAMAVSYGIVSAKGDHEMMAATA